MLENLLSDPRCSRQQISSRTSLDQLQVLLDGTMRICVHFHVREVLIDEPNKTGEVSLSVDDLVDCPKLAPLAVAVFGAARLAAEPELLLLASISLLSLLHVLVDLADWNQKVELERQNDSSQQHDEHNDRCVLKVCQLKFAWSELDSPANRRVGRGRLEAHRLPVRRLNVLEVIGFFLVVLVNFLAEQRHRVSDEEMSNVLGEQMINSTVAEHLIILFVVSQLDVVVSLTFSRQIRVDRVISRLVDPVLVLFQRL